MSLLSGIKKVVIGDPLPSRRKRWETARDTALAPTAEFRLAQEVVRVVHEAGELRVDDIARAVGRPRATKRPERQAAWRDLVTITDDEFDAALKMAIRAGLISPKIWSNAYTKPRPLEAEDVRRAIVETLDRCHVADLFLLEDLTPKPVRGRVGATLPWAVMRGDVQWAGPRVFSRGEVTRDTRPPAELEAA